MQQEENKEKKKPFKGVGTPILSLSLTLVQAKVSWPPDMPDDMLEDAITISKKTLDEHDFESQGVEVTHSVYFNC